MGDELLYFNGVDGDSGQYLTPPMPPAMVSQLARGKTLDKAHLNELKWWHYRTTQATLAPREGIDPKKLSQTGWGVIFAHSDPRAAAIREALDELLNLRREQAGEYYKEYWGVDAYRPDESKQEFLSRHGAGPGPVDPKNVPYYLLLVGDPEQIRYRFQYQLDVQYAVGRLHFENLEDYARYARSVVDSENGKVRLPRHVTLFGVQNPDDPATNLSAQELITPLASYLSEKQKPWRVQSLIKEEATKSRLGSLLGGAETPAVLFTASHGLGFAKDSPRQLPHQGALLCQDWPGPKSRLQSITPDQYFAADDISDDANLLGLISFHFACYGAGTPMMDDFSHQAFNAPKQIAPHAFVARLPQRLLGHPRGGALAVVGHVERAWGCSFVWDRAGRQLQTFESTFDRLLDGHPVGSAFEFFNERYAELSTDLNNELEEVKFGKQPNDLELAGMWTANNDARGYAIIGDPAVRLPVVAEGEKTGERASIELITLSQPGSESIDAAAAAIAAATTGQLPAPHVASRTGAGLGYPQSNSMSAAEAAALDFGIMDSFKDARTRLADALQHFASKLGEAIEQTVSDASSLEIATFVSDDMSDITFKDGQFGGGAKLRVLTRISIGGDTVVCVPVEQGEVDEALWKVHSEMVQRAQAHRAEMLKTFVSAASGLLEVFKGF